MIVKAIYEKMQNFALDLLKKRREFFLNHPE